LQNIADRDDSNRGMFLEVTLGHFIFR